MMENTWPLNVRERETIKLFSLIQMRRELSYKRRDAVYMHITNNVGKPAKSFFIHLGLILKKRIENILPIKLKHVHTHISAGGLTRLFDILDPSKGDGLIDTAGYCSNIF